MSRQEDQDLGSSETGSFRKLVEGKISVDEYVQRLDQRVQERHANEEQASKSERSPAPEGV